MKKREFVLIVTHLLTPPSLFLKHPILMNMTLSSNLVLPETLMIEGGNSKYHDSLEELFILQNIADLKVIRYEVFTFDFEFKMSG